MSDDLLCIVGATQVYLWAFRQQPVPSPIFNLDEKMMSAQILSLSLSPNRQWFTISGLTQVDGALAKVTMVYSVARKAGQIVAGSAAAIGQIGESQVLGFFDDNCVQLLDLSGQLGNRQVQVAALQGQIVTTASVYQSILFLGSRDGLVVLIDLETASVVAQQQMQTILKSVSAPDGVLFLDVTGQITLVAPPATLALQRFDSLIAQQNFSAAARMALTTPAVRTQETLSRLAAFPANA